MKHLQKRIISIVMLCALLLSSVALMTSCGDQTDNGTDTTAPLTPSDSQKYGLPDADFNGEIIDFFLWEKSGLEAEEVNGQVINDATYKRNAAVAARYNVQFAYRVEPGHVGNRVKWIQMVNDSILGGDDSFDIVGGYAYHLATEGVQGKFFNLAENIDFSKPWWPQNFVDAGSIDNKLFMCLGNIDTSFYDNNFAIYYNKQIAEEYQIPNLYEIVRSGQWTIDKLIEYSKQAITVGVDINDNYQYGYLTSHNVGYDTFIQSCEVVVSERDAENNPVLNLNNIQHYMDVQEKLSGFVNDASVVKTSLNSDTGETATVFGNGYGLFLNDKIGSAHLIRESSEAYGVIPLPKWNEDQDDYVTYNCVHNATGYLVPITSDLEMCSTVLDALGAYGLYELRPEYYDRVIRTRYGSDEEWGTMLDLVFDNVEIEFTQFYSMIWGDLKSPFMMMRMTTQAQGEYSAGFSSVWASKKRTFKAELDNFLEIVRNSDM